jgi:hypothetical protein
MSAERPNSASSFSFGATMMPVSPMLMNWLYYHPASACIKAPRLEMT